MSQPTMCYLSQLLRFGLFFYHKRDNCYHIQFVITMWTAIYTRIHRALFCLTCKFTYYRPDNMWSTVGSVLVDFLV